MQELIDNLSAEALRLTERLYEIRVADGDESVDAMILAAAADDMLALQIELVTRPTKILWCAEQAK